MPQIRPVSDLRNSFAEISRVVHQSDEPVILTRNGYGDMVVLSYDVYEKLQYELAEGNSVPSGPSYGSSWLPWEWGQVT